MWIGNQSISIAQVSAPVKSGIHFLSGTYAAASKAAKAAHKPLFVEIYLTGCPHCEALAPILTEKRVGDFFNAQFVNWKTEANSPDSKALQNAKSITYPEFPLLLFFDAEGALIHIATPAEHPEKNAFVNEVIAIGQTALNPAQRTSSYDGRFTAGDRDLGFLINYGKYCKVRKDNARLHTISDAIGSALSSPEQLKSPVGFYCLQRIIDDVDNPAAIYFFGHLNEFTSNHPVKDVKETGENIIFRSLYGAKGDQYSVQKVVRMREYMVGLGVPANEAASRTILKELDAHLRAKDTQGAVRRFNDYRQQNPTIIVADYAYLMHYFNEKATDNSYLVEMPIWAAEGLKKLPADQQNSKPVADVYYELAVAYHKLGQKGEALANAQKGLSTAQKAKISTEQYQKQLTAFK